ARTRWSAMLTSGSPDLDVFEELDGRTREPGRPDAFSTLGAVSSPSRPRRAWLPAGTAAVVMSAIVATGLLGHFVPAPTHQGATFRPATSGAARSGAATSGTSATSTGSAAESAAPAA